MLWQELTNRSFCRLLVRVASDLGFRVKRWPLKDADGWPGIEQLAPKCHGIITIELTMYKQQKNT